MDESRNLETERVTKRTRQIFWKGGRYTRNAELYREKKLENGIFI
jgi:hypothetical protein